jgi:hypothetical protein
VLCGRFRAIESDHRALGGDARELMQETGSSMANGSAARANTLLDHAERRGRNATSGNDWYTASTDTRLSPHRV